MRSLYVTVLACPLLATLSACAHTDRVELQNQQTGQRVSCGPYPDFALRATASALQLNQCIQDFEKQGFVRLPVPSTPTAAK